MKIDVEKLKKEKSIQELLEFGIINIDKPSGPTSFDISDFVREKLQLRKTSHFGTLDPKVTGVLPIALNRGCKLTGFFLGEDKEYVGVMRLHEEISMKELQEMINSRFLGKIKQLPPVKSRVARILREREIKSFEILEQSEDKKSFLFKTEVQGGTYIRKLIHDLGEELGFGAHMLELRRIRAGIFGENGIFFENKKHNAGIFSEDDKNYPSVNLYDFEEAVKRYEEGNEKPLREIIIPGEVVSELFSIVEIKEEAAEKILRGQPIYNENLVEMIKLEKGGLVCVFSKDKFIGIFKVVSEGRVFAKPEFVFQPVS